MENNDVERLMVAVFGTKPNHEDGLLGIASSHSTSLYGTVDNPGGISKDVRTMKRWVGMASAVVSICGVALVIIQFLSKVIPLIKHVAG